MSNAVSSPEPIEITRETRSGRRWPSALAKWPPRQWPISASGRPGARRRSARARLERVERAVGAADVAGDPGAVRPVAHPLQPAAPSPTATCPRPGSPGSASPGRRRRAARPRPAKTGSIISRASSACQRSSAPWRPHQRRGASGAADGGGVGSNACGHRPGTLPRPQASARAGVDHVDRSDAQPGGDRGEGAADGAEVRARERDEDAESDRAERDRDRGRLLERRRPARWVRSRRSASESRIASS